MGVRRLVTLVSNLPPKSAVHRAFDPEGWDWDMSRELQAATIEVLDLANAMYQAAHEKDGSGRLRKLLHVPRPTPDEEPEVASAAEIEAFFGAGGAEIKSSEPVGEVVTADDIRRELRKRTE